MSLKKTLCFYGSIYSNVDSKQHFRSNRPVCVSSGKSALHWAAAVNNVEAAIVLLKNGANKDMQNNKVKNKQSVPSS